MRKEALVTHRNSLLHPHSDPWC